MGGLQPALWNFVRHEIFFRLGVGSFFICRDGPCFLIAGPSLPFFPTDQMAVEDDMQVLESSIIIDGLPVVPPEKFDKLQTIGWLPFLLGA